MLSVTVTVTPPSEVPSGVDDAAIVLNARLVPYTDATASDASEYPPAAEFTVTTELAGQV